jgi:cell wall-associated NlpC family hydrolase
MQDKIIEYARECLDTPYLHQGRIKGIGLDCVGIVVYIAGKLGYSTSEDVNYRQEPSSGQIESAADRQYYLDRIYDDNMKPSDILMMRFEKDPQHVAIFTGENIIHSYSTVGKVVEHRLDHRWKNRIVRVYRFKDIK